MQMSELQISKFQEEQKIEEKLTDGHLYQRDNMLDVLYMMMGGYLEEERRQLEELNKKEEDKEDQEG